MKVYVVFSDDGEAPVFEGVFSRRDLAVSWMRDVAGLSSPEANIQEVEVDDRLHEYRGRQYRAMMLVDGTVQQRLPAEDAVCRTDQPLWVTDQPVNPQGRWWWDGWSDAGYPRVFCGFSTVSQQQADEAVAAAYRAWRAKGG